MYIIASFEQSIFLELAITALEQMGLGKDQILAVPLDRRKEPRRLFDTIHRADGSSLFDVAAVLGTCGMLLGAIYGMVLAWGPILWGIIGLVLGLLVGFVIKYLFVRREVKLEMTKGAQTEVFLMIRCNLDERTKVEDILWDHTALGVAKLHRDGLQ